MSKGVTETFASKTGYRIVRNGKLVINTTTRVSADLISDALADEAPMRYINSLID